MFTPYDEQFEELRAGFQAQLAQIGELQSRMREVTGTAMAKAQAMKVTVGPQGELLSSEPGMPDVVREYVDRGRAV
ncbi:hypothetical protein [Streptomyces bauhiniae]|uniref:hypothetical protein n=1 Tax=Streptomyces bauhiniae TaxID=2340725 RepID=UPI0035E10D26